MAEWGYGTTLGFDGMFELLGIVLIAWLLPSTIRAKSVALAAESIATEGADAA